MAAKTRVTPTTGAAGASGTTLRVEARGREQGRRPATREQPLAAGAVRGAVRFAAAEGGNPADATATATAGGGSGAADGLAAHPGHLAVGNARIGAVAAGAVAAFALLCLLAWVVFNNQLAGRVGIAGTVAVALALVGRLLRGGLLSGERFVSARVLAWGEPLRHEVVLRTVKRPGPWALPLVFTAPVTLHDASTLPGHPVAGVLDLHMRGDVQPWRPQCSTTHRGRWRLGPTWGLFVDSFGFFPNWRLVAHATWIVIKPRILDLKRSLLDVDGGHEGLQRGRLRNEQPPDVAGTRTFRLGDGTSRIHWAASARSVARGGGLVSKLFEPSTDAALWFAVDLNAAGAAPAAGAGAAGGGPAHGGRAASLVLTRAAADLMATVVASLALYHLQRHMDVGVVASGAHRVSLLPRRGARHQDELLLALAEVAPQRESAPAAAGAPPLLDGVRAHIRSGHTLVLVTASEPQQWRDAILDLRRHGVRVVIIAIGPGGQRWIRPALWLPLAYAQIEHESSLLAALEGRVIADATTAHA